MKMRGHSLGAPVGFSHGPPQKRRKPVMTVSASMVPGDTGGAAASGHSAIAACSTHCATAAVGVPESQLWPAAAAAPLLEGASEQQPRERSLFLRESSLFLRERSLFLSREKFILPSRAREKKF